LEEASLFGKKHWKTGKVLYEKGAQLAEGRKSHIII
jgi:hypothetical protein